MVLTDNVTVVKRVATDKKIVALTFDDGPNPATTKQILTVLRERQVRATFFVLGLNVEKHPEVLAQTVADGHEIGSHSYTHRILSKLSEQEYVADLLKGEEVISAIAPKPVLFRPPGGGWNDKMVEVVYRLGYSTILWSVDSEDWKNLKVERVVNNVVNTVKPGSIILMHDGQYPLPTAEAVRIIIDTLHKQGYTFVTVTDLIRQM